MWYKIWKWKELVYVEVVIRFFLWALSFKNYRKEKISQASITVKLYQLLSTKFLNTLTEKTRTSIIKTFSPITRTSREQNTLMIFLSSVVIFERDCRMFKDWFFFCLRLLKTVTLLELRGATVRTKLKWKICHCELLALIVADSLLYNKMENLL